MDSYLVEDVKELLKLKKGDSGRLNRIKDACDANEIVSLSDRKYVERLSSQYLHKIEQKKPKAPEKPKFVPIEEPEIITSTEKVLPEIQTEQIEISIPEEVRPEKEPSKPFDFSTNKKMILAIGAVALAIILVAVVAIGYEGVEFPDNSAPISSGPLPEFSLETDESSYETKDIISISGKILSPSSDIVKLSIENEKGKLIWSENLNLKSNGEFSTLLIAGGTGWEDDGAYILNGQHDDLSNKISFDFNAK